MKRLLSGIGVAVAMLMLISGVASAMPIGDPIVTNSWAQWWHEDGFGSAFDTIVMRMVSPVPDTFEMPALTPDGGFPNTNGWSWTETLNDGRNAVWTGPDTTATGNFYINFNGPMPGNPLTFDLLEFLDSGAIASWRYTYDGSDRGYYGWSWTENSTAGEVIPSASDPGNPVPEPASMGILGFGLLGLVVTRMRRKVA